MLQARGSSCRAIALWNPAIVVSLPKQPGRDQPLTLCQAIWIIESQNSNGDTPLRCEWDDLSITDLKMLVPHLQTRMKQGKQVVQAGSERPSVSLLNRVGNLRFEHDHDVLEPIQFRKFCVFLLTQQTCLIERKQPLQPALRPITDAW